MWVDLCHVTCLAVPTGQRKTSFTLLPHDRLHFSFLIYPYFHALLSSLFYHFTLPPSYFYSSPYSSTLHFLYHYSLSATSSFSSNSSPHPPSTVSTFFYLFCPPRLSSPTPPCSDSQNRALEVLRGGGYK